MVAEVNNPVFKIEPAPGDRLEDLLGIDNVVAAARLVIDGIVNADFMLAHGVEPTTSLFLYGESGTGKSTLARALPGAIQKRTKEQTDLLTLTTEHVYASSFGTPEEAIRKAFDDAEQYPRRAVLFFNEADGLFSRPVVEGENRVPGICKDRLERVRTNNPRLVVVAATNHRSALDPAIYAPQRFNYQLHFPKPKADMQVKILDRLMQEARYGAGRPVFDSNIRASFVFQDSPHFSGGHLKEIVRRAKQYQVLRAAGERRHPEQVDAEALGKIIREYSNEIAS